MLGIKARRKTVAAAGHNDVGSRKCLGKITGVLADGRLTICRNTTGSILCRFMVLLGYNNYLISFTGYAFN